MDKKSTLEKPETAKEAVLPVAKQTHFGEPRAAKPQFGEDELKDVDAGTSGLLPSSFGSPSGVSSSSFTDSSLDSSGSGSGEEHRSAINEDMLSDVDSTLLKTNPKKDKRWIKMSQEEKLRVKRRIIS